VLYGEIKRETPVHLKTADLALLLLQISGSFGFYNFLIFAQPYQRLQPRGNLINFRYNEFPNLHHLEILPPYTGSLVPAIVVLAVSKVFCFCSSLLENTEAYVFRLSKALKLRGVAPLHLNEISEHQVSASIEYIHDWRRIPVGFIEISPTVRCDLLYYP